MSEPSSQCKRAFESFARTGGSFRFDPLERTMRTGVSPTLSPKKAEELIMQKLLKDDKERRHLGSQAGDRLAPWIPTNYATPQGVPVALTTTTPGNTETGMSQRPRFDTPPPGEKYGPPPSPRSPCGDESLDELATSALQSDALVEAVTGPTTLAEIVEEGKLVGHWIRLPLRSSPLTLLARSTPRQPGELLAPGKSPRLRPIFEG